MMTSAADTPSPLWMSVGMPRPLSRTVTEPSGFSDTSMRSAEAGQRLVDGVVDDFIDHVMQARAVVGVADIHAGALAHGIEALQDLDRLGVVGVFLADGFGGHQVTATVTPAPINAVPAIWFTRRRALTVTTKARTRDAARM